MKKYKWIFEEWLECWKDIKWYLRPYLILASIFAIPFALFIQSLESESDYKAHEEHMDFLFSQLSTETVEKYFNSCNTSEKK